LLLLRAFHAITYAAAAILPSLLLTALLFFLDIDFRLIFSLMLYYAADIVDICWRLTLFHIISLCLMRRVPPPPMLTMP